MSYSTFLKTSDTFDNYDQLQQLCTSPEDFSELRVRFLCVRFFLPNYCFFFSAFASFHVIATALCLRFNGFCLMLLRH